MKWARILVSLVLIVSLMASAISAFAEEAPRLVTATVENITYAENGEDPIPLELGIVTHMGGSMKEGEEFAVLSGEIISGPRPVASYRVSVQDEEIRLGLDGLSSNYSITMDELMELSGAPATVLNEIKENEALMARMGDMTSAYVKAIQEGLALENDPEAGREILRAMGLDLEGEGAAEEAVEVFGESMTLRRFDVSMDMDALDQMYATLLRRMPSLREFYEMTAEFLEEASDSAARLDMDHIVTSMFEPIGVDVRLDMTLWMDEAEENARMEMTVKTIEADDETTLGPMIMEVKTDADGQHVRMSMENVSERTGAQAGSAAMDINDKRTDQGAEGDLTMTTIAAGEETTVSARWVLDERGEGTLEIRVETAGGMGDINFGFALDTKGNLAEDGKVASHVKLDFAMISDPETPGKDWSVEFDVAVETAALPDPLFDEKGKPTVRIAEMTQEDRTKLNEEITAFGITAMGSLMSSPGIGKLIARAMGQMTVIDIPPESDMQRPEDV